MSKVHYLTASSLDGFIADSDNSLEWLFEVPHAPEDDHWDRWFPGIGGLVMGATTYTWMLHHDDMVRHPERWHEYYGDRPGWVFTHRELPSIPPVAVTFVQGDVRAVHARIVAAVADSDIWVVGGGDLVGQFYDAGLLDQIHVSLTPVTLGSGAPLLPRRITSRNLVFREAELLGQRVRVTLDVHPAA